MKNSQYKSPTHKLISFFKTSRDKWKAKAQNAKKKIRSLTEMLRKVRQRRDELQTEVKELRQQVKELDKQLQTIRPKPNQQKKRSMTIIEQNSAITSSSNTKYQAETSLVPANHPLWRLG